MKKFFLSIPILSILVCLMYVNAGPNSWTQDLSNVGIFNDCIKINPVTPNIMYAGSNGAGIYKSTNSGVNWATSNSGLTNLTVQCLAISASNPSIVMCGTSSAGSGAGVYKSTDAGATWTNMSSGITDPLYIQVIVIDYTNPNNCYLGTFDAVTNMAVGVWKSTNGGSSWSSSNSGIGTIKNILSMTMNPKNSNELYCGTSFDPVTGAGPQKIYKTLNAGATWTDVSTGLPQLSTDTDPVRAMSVSFADTNVVLAALFENVTTNGGMFLTTNGGASWSKIQTGLPNVAGTLFRSCLIRPGSTTEFYCGIDATQPPGGIWRSTNHGASWVDFDGGPLANTNTIRSISFRATGPGDSTLYAGSATGNTGVYEYSFFPVGISNQNGNVPKEFALHQNYPNPFNPTTVISFDIPKDANVSINVYDISGRLVKNLMNEGKKAGTYQINFNSNSLASGVYFYKLVSGNFIETKKMILVK